MNDELEKYAVGYCMTDKEFSRTDGKAGRYVYFNEISPGDFIFTSYFVKDLQTKLDEQAKELEALRGLIFNTIKTGVINHDEFGREVVSYMPSVIRKLFDEFGS